jgi:Flp pilus assembly protein TadG
MRRLASNERGAVAVIVAIMLAMLAGIAALTIDSGNLYWERRQLQNAADAGALAAAQDLVVGESEATAYATARQYADENNHRGAHVAPSGSADPGFVTTPNSVTVTAQTGSFSAPGQLPSILAGVVGVEQYATRASATASWGNLGGGNTIPLTFSVCEWNQMTGGDVNNLPTGERTVYFHSSQTAAQINSCGGPANQNHPGGFGWLSPQGGQCQAYVENGQVDTDVGNNVPSVCTSTYLESLLGQTVLMPIFSSVVSPQGSNAIYQISGFAALEITGYRFSGNPEYNRPLGSPPCSGNDRCIRGRFVSYYDLGNEPVVGGIDYGAYFIGLTG